MQEINLNQQQQQKEEKTIKDSLITLQRILASTKLGDSLLNKTLLIEQ